MRNENPHEVLEIWRELEKVNSHLKVSNEVRNQLPKENRVTRKKYQ
jgi:hypothetical protein